MNSEPLTRRRFLTVSVVAVPILIRWPVPLRECEHDAVRARRRDRHPTPRPGIDAARVMTADELKSDSDAIVAFDEVRQIPHIVDGVRCSCGCAEREGNYSLLSCFERPHGMARTCERCQRQARLAFRLHQQGKSLADIREAMDSRYR